ncbi:MAG TPA: hypothetical protein PKE04_18695, partial [Clostridia bacterium]|nr:hypothetical protein [Clostridia bacterium]
DCMRVRCDAPRQIDWVFHSEGEAAFEGSMAEAGLPETENGYGYLTDVRRVEGPFAARFTINGETLSLKFRSLPENAAIYVTKSPNNPANLQRHTVIVRTKASEAEIQAVYTIDRRA